MSFRLAGVMGWPISHSLSPRLHGYWLKKHAILGAYVPLAVTPESLPAALSGLSALGFQGCNVTVPHKQKVIPHLQHLTERAKRIGAVNTIWREEEALCGDCTDGLGFLADMNAVFPGWTAYKESVVLIGAGGAARAVLVALHDEGCRSITILNRTREHAAAMCDSLSISATVRALDDAAALDGAGLIINTTSLGMTGQPPLQLDFGRVAGNALAYDLVYTPAETPFLENARRHGLQTANGLGMLLHQAVPGFERWFGQRPTVDDDVRAYMKAALSC